MNIPNALTILRLFMVPVFVFLYSNGDSFEIRLSSAIVFILAAFTDVLDGYIARKYNLITDFGKLADPVADKLMQLSAIGCLALNGRISLWIVALFVLKEALMIVGGLSLLKDKFVVQSKWSGKIATVILFITVIIILVTDQSMLPKPYATMLMFFSIFATMVAFFDYAKMYLKVKEKMQKSRNNKENL